MPEDGKRSRVGRTPPRILRNTDGDSYAIEAHADAPPSSPTSEGRFHVDHWEYDDGNGLWIDQRETPIYLDFCRKYYPQDYTPREA